MITGGEEKEEAVLERADRGMMREAILAAAQQARRRLLWSSFFDTPIRW